MRDEKLLTLKAKCICCGQWSNKIRLQGFKLGEENISIPFVACDRCYADKKAIEEAILTQGLHKQTYPGGLEKRHVELVG